MPRRSVMVIYNISHSETIDLHDFAGMAANWFIDCSITRFKGEERYCLKIHLMAIPASTETINSICWGIKMGNWTADFIK